MISGKYPYDEVLAKSLLFYEAERSGPLPSDNRFYFELFPFSRKAMTKSGNSPKDFKICNCWTTAKCRVPWRGDSALGDAVREHQYQREVLHDQTDFLHLGWVAVRVFISGWGEGGGVDGGRDVWTYKGRHKKAVFCLLSKKWVTPPYPLFAYTSFFFLIRIFWIGQESPLLFFGEKW